MKLLHLGDLHIGKSVNNYSMIEDQKYILDQILTIAQEQSVDGLSYQFMPVIQNI